jgi:SOS response regulatory protein OraA/RecX
MSKLGKMVKNMVKTKKESVMGKLGDAPYEDPMEPWSAKYNAPVKEETLAEDSILYRYIRSKGYSPEHMDFAHRSAFARSRAFKTYKVMHQKTKEKPQGGISDIIVSKEEVEHISEAGVGKLMNFIKAKGLDPTTMDNNQKKNYSGSSEYRVFKVIHPEDPKKQLLQDKKKKLKETSGMGERGEDWSDATDEPFIKVKAKTKKLKEEADAVDTVTMDIPLLIRVLEFAREDAKTDMDLHKVVENLIKMRGDGTLSMQNYAKIVAIKEHIESLDELSKETLKSYVNKVATGPSRGKTQTGTLKSIKAIGGVTKAIRKQYEKPITELKKQTDNMDTDDHITREAMENPCWTGYKMVGSKEKNGKTVPNCVPSGRKNIIKSAAKKKLGESTYDWEKDDKGDNKKPNAKVIMKGGTTMTGKPRDTVEIEPVLKTRPNSASGGKPGV